MIIIIIIIRSKEIKIQKYLIQKKNIFILKIKKIFNQLK